METKPRKYANKVFKYLLILFFIAFLTLYLSESAGYYEYANREKNILTEKQIKEFEKDVKNGKDIKIEDYIEKTKIDYSNKASDLGKNLSNTINEGVKKGIEEFFGLLNNMIEGK